MCHISVCVVECIRFWDVRTLYVYFQKLLNFSAQIKVFTGEMQSSHLLPQSNLWGHVKTSIPATTSGRGRYMRHFRRIWWIIKSYTKVLFVVEWLLHRCCVWNLCVAKEFVRAYVWRDIIHMLCLAHALPWRRRWNNRFSCGIHFE